MINQQVEMFLNTHSELRPQREGLSHWKIKCPVCGDSSYKSTKKRGYFLSKNNTFIYKCFNDGCECGSAVPFQIFLKRYFPSDYVELNFRSEYRGSEYQRPNTSTEVADFGSMLSTPTETPIEEVKYNPWVHFVSIFDQSKYHDLAMKFVEDRFIDYEIYKNWYVAVSGNYFGRLIIPFLGADGEPYFFQARTLIGQEPKYLNQVGAKQIYNIEWVDFKSPVFVFEGAIDAMHCENAVAVQGLGDVRLIDIIIKKCGSELPIFVFDDDEAGKTQAEEFLKLGRRVFLWARFREHFKLPQSMKLDLNGFVSKYIKERTFFSSEFMLQFASGSYYDRFML